MIDRSHGKASLNNTPTDHLFRDVSLGGQYGTCKQCWHCGAVFHLERFWLHDRWSTKLPPCEVTMGYQVLIDAWLQGAQPRTPVFPGIADQAREMIESALSADPRVKGEDASGLASSVLQIVRSLLQTAGAASMEAIEINGYQLSEALEFLAPDRSRSQLADALTICNMPEGGLQARYKGDAGGPQVTLGHGPLYVRGASDKA